MLPVGALAGFVGAWLLVAGPVYQAATELDSEQVDRAALDAADRSVGAASQVSAWWWLLPPAGLVLQRRATWRRRERVLELMSVAEVDRLTSFGAKATGWLLVAVGGLLIAVKETLDLGEALHWFAAAPWLVMPLALLASLAYAVLRLRQDRRRRARAGTALEAGSSAPG